VGLTATKRGRLTIIVVVAVLLVGSVVGLRWWDGTRAADDADRAEEEAAALLRDLGEGGYATALTGEGVGIQHAAFFGAQRDEGGGYTLVWQVRRTTTARCVVGTYGPDGEVTTRVEAGRRDSCDGVLEGRSLTP
jgi:hypothetical protein